MHTKSIFCAVLFALVACGGRTGLDYPDTLTTSMGDDAGSPMGSIRMAETQCPSPEFSTPWACLPGAVVGSGCQACQDGVQCCETGVHPHVPARNDGGQVDAPEMPPCPDGGVLVADFCVGACTLGTCDAGHLVDTGAEQ